MANLTSEIVINLSGNINQRAKQYSGAMNQFARTNQRSMAIVRRSTAAAGRTLDGLTNRYTGLVTGGGALLLARQVGATSEALTRLSTNTGLNEKQMEALRTVSAALPRPMALIQRC